MKIVNTWFIICILFISMIFGVFPVVIASSTIETNFSDDFNSSTLNEHWQVTPGLGSYSLMDNPGYLRQYLLGHKATGWAWHYGAGGGWTPSLMFSRTFEGEHWRMQAKVTYNLHESSPSGGSPGAQYSELWVAFGNETTSPYFQTQRGVDKAYESNTLSANVGEPQMGFQLQLAPGDVIKSEPSGGWVRFTYWYQLIREGQHLTFKYSDDGVNYVQGFDIPWNQTFGNSQRVGISSTVWDTYGSYADWDYIRVTPTKITVPDDYPTIQEAINVASPGDSIFVRAGTYHEHVTINKNNLTLIGEDRRRTIIDGDGSGQVAYLNSVIGVKISGFTFRNGTYGLFMTASSNNYINDIAANSNSQYGILMRTSSNNNTIANSIISLNSQEGIRLDQGSYCSYNLIETCEVFANGGPYDGIGINFGDFGGQYHNTARGCHIYANKKGPGGSGGHGIGGGVTTDETTVLGCHIHDNDGFGAIAGWSKWTIKNSLIHSNDADGILLDTSSNSIISNNTIYSNNNGISIAGLQHYGHNTVVNNTVYGNYENGIYFNIYANNNVYYHNSFVNNFISNIYDTGFSNKGDHGYSSGGNFWSDYNGQDRFSGPYQNITGADGIGDTPYTVSGILKDMYPLMNPWNPTLSVEGDKTWYWISNTTINSVAVGDLDGDGQKETVTGGSYYDGTHNIAQLVIWDSSSILPERLTTWYWNGNTTISSVAIGDVNGDGMHEIVTGGYYFDGTRNVAQLVVWKGNDLSVDNLKVWYWSGDTQINSIAIGDVDADGQTEIVTGGTFFDGMRNVAQLVVWTGSNLAVDKLTSWYWSGDTQINSIAIGDVDADGQTEIVTGGTFFDGMRNVAQLVVWTGSNLAVDKLTSWYWSGDTQINSIAIGDVDADGQTEIVTAGYYNDGTRNVAQLVIMLGSTLTVNRLTSWYWTSNTEINSVEIGDINGDGNVEIVTGGSCFDGTRSNAQLVVWSGSNLANVDTKTWYFTGDTAINSVTVGNLTGDLSSEIVTGGTFYDGTRLNSQITVWGNT